MKLRDADLFGELNGRPREGTWIETLWDNLVTGDVSRRPVHMDDWAAEIREYCCGGSLESMDRNYCANGKDLQKVGSVFWLECGLKSGAD